MLVIDFDPRKITFDFFSKEINNLGNLSSVKIRNRLGDIIKLYDNLLKYKNEGKFIDSNHTVFNTLDNFIEILVDRATALNKKTFRQYTNEYEYEKK